MEKLQISLTGSECPHDEVYPCEDEVGTEWAAPVLMIHTWSGVKPSGDTGHGRAVNLIADFTEDEELQVAVEKSKKPDPDGLVVAHIGRVPRHASQYVPHVVIYQ